MFEVGACVHGLSRTYVVLGEHACGGMSRTYRARVEGTETDVLLKVTSFAGMRDWRAFERFEREARTLSSLSHPRIPKSLELFAWDGKASLDPSAVSAGETPVALIHVQELVVGRSLAAALQAGARFSADELQKLYRELLETLSYLHALLPPVLHRDLQPRNVILDREGRPHLVDFGLSLESEASTHSVSFGAPGYVAPELVLGIASPKADLYALAATILTAASHIAAPEFPRDAKTGRILVQKASPGLPPALAATLARSLEVDFRKRTATTNAALASLSGRRSLASRVSLGTSRGRIAAFSALGLTLLLVPVSLGVLAHRRHASEALARSELAKLEQPSSKGDEVEPGPVGTADPDAKTEPPPVATPAGPIPPKPVVEWLGHVVATGPDGPKLGARCALTASRVADQYNYELTCDSPSNSNGISQNLVFARSVSSDDQGSQCVLSQTKDSLPDHYRYALTAVNEGNDIEDSIFIDTRKRVVRFDKHVGGATVRIRVSLDGETSRPIPVDVLDGPSTFPEGVRFRGTVKTVDGNAPVAFGASCTANIEPRDSMGKNCSIDVSCGGKQLYRQTMALCGLSADGDAFAGYSDRIPSSFDDTPRMVVEGRGFELSDETPEGSWSVSMEMSRDK